MPYNVLWDEDVFHKPFSGVVTEAEFLQSADKTHGDPRFDTLRYAINDFSGVSEFRFTPDTFDEWTGKTLGSSFTNRQLHVLFVTTDASVIKAIRDLDSIAAGHYSIQIFPSLEAAKVWIHTDRKKPR